MCVSWQSLASDSILEAMRTRCHFLTGVNKKDWNIAGRIGFCRVYTEYSGVQQTLHLHQL